MFLVNLNHFFVLIKVAVLKVICWECGFKANKRLVSPNFNEDKYFNIFCGNKFLSWYYYCNTLFTGQLFAYLWYLTIILILVNRNWIISSWSTFNYNAWRHTMMSLIWFSKLCLAGHTLIMMICTLFGAGFTKFPKIFIFPLNSYVYQGFKFSIELISQLFIILCHMYNVNNIRLKFN